MQSCNVCKKQFANVYRLQRHMISHDESAGLRRFKCADCGKAFKFKHHLKVRENGSEDYVDDILLLKMNISRST